MSQKTRRHIFLFVLAVLVILGVLHLQGCAADYTWTRSRPAAVAVEWRVVPREKLHFHCNLTRDQAPTLGGCAWWNADVCIVYSHLDAETARRTFSGDGLDLYAHEVRHCDGWVHGQFAGWTK